MSSYRGVLSIIIASYFKKYYLIATIDEPNSWLYISVNMSFFEHILHGVLGIVYI